MVKDTSKTYFYSMTGLFMVAYLVSYMTRINFGAVISEMVTSTGMARTSLSIAVTGSFVTYGIGQIISGICGDKFQPKRLVLCGFAITIIMNLLIPLCKNHIQMLAVWCINGFAQAFMWPPMVRLMTSIFSAEQYKRASVVVSWGSSVGTIVIYLVSPLIISLVGWRGVFVFSAVCAVCMMVMWQKKCCLIEMKSKTVTSKTPGESFLTPVLIFVMISVVLQGMLRDGITTWMPSYISETFNMGNEMAILSGVALPLFSIFCFQAAATINRKVLKNPICCAGTFFLTGTVFAVFLYLFSAQNAALAVFLSALLTGCMHGVNLMLTCMIPPYFMKHSKVAFITGLLNSCTYVGSAAAIYMNAWISEKYSWNAAIGCWAIVAAAGAALCLACAKPWDKRYKL